MARKPDPRTPSRAGLFDPRSRGPRLIVYLFVVLLAVVFLPFLSENRYVVLAVLLIGGPLIAAISIRSWKFRDYHEGVARTAIEAGPLFGIGVTVLAIADLLGFRIFTE